MKRSEINAIMRAADAFIRERGFYLPPFAYWRPEAWQERADEAEEIRARGLGWDITDFGQGNFAEMGLFLFTLRNGDLAALEEGRGKLYAEKLLVVEEGQVTPLHHHGLKTEDIINRGGGRLLIQLFGVGEAEELAQTPVEVGCDGVRRTVAAGETITLHPGESVTLTPDIYHKFWAEGGRVLVGEVSTVNDDQSDNYFYEPLGRFPQIEEDEAPLYLLVGDYDRL